MSKKYYAFIIEKDGISKIVTTWAECQNATRGKSARYKSFKTELEAKQWLSNGGLYENKKEKIKELKSLLFDGIYFDAGTGRGIGVEVRVTNRQGDSLLEFVLPNDMINEFGNYLSHSESTNNYGELIGLYLALEVASKQKINRIFGDSKLIIDYWSKGHCNRSKLNEKTLNLIKRTTIKRKQFEDLGGVIEHISGDINPADLGFHK